MHALITVTAANQATANALAKQHFDQDGGEHTFTIPLYALGSTDDTTPLAYLASPEFVTPGKIEAARQMVAALAGSQMAEYDLSQPFDVTAQLVTWGYRRALPTFP